MVAVIRNLYWILIVLPVKGKGLDARCAAFGLSEQNPIYPKHDLLFDLWFVVTQPYLSSYTQ